MLEAEPAALRSAATSAGGAAAPPRSARGSEASWRARFCLVRCFSPCTEDLPLTKSRSESEHLQGGRVHTTQELGQSLACHTLQSTNQQWAAQLLSAPLQKIESVFGSVDHL